MKIPSNIICPYCKSKQIIKKGFRKNKLQTSQKYQCRTCFRYFINKLLINKSYPPQIILSAISNYNLGHSQNKVTKLINSRFKIKVPQRTISQWINQYKHICTFHRLRKQAIKLCKPKQVISKQNLHYNQIYKYQLHNAKLQLLANELPKRKYELLKQYLHKITTNDFPHHIFKPKKETIHKLPRASQLKFKTLPFVKKKKQNLANKLAEFGLMLAKTNRKKHEAIQNFMLINDSVTIATEVPVYLTKNDINYFTKKGFKLNLSKYYTPITGHIDLLQIRNKLIHILDYKPDAINQNPVEQLSLYALALASRTKLAIKDFKCAWFDHKNYFEFYPLHVVYKKS